MRQRTIVCPLIQNDGAYLLCKMADDRGVFPGQWALSVAAWSLANGIEEALRREIREELGEQLLLTEITPWTFSDDIRTKTYADGRKEEIYMIYLIFDCVSANRDVKINEEFQDYAWVKPEDLVHYDLNVATRKTLRLKGLLYQRLTAITGCQIENLVVNEFPIQINFAFSTCMTKPSR